MFINDVRRALSLKNETETFSKLANFRKTKVIRGVFSFFEKFITFAHWKLIKKREPKPSLFAYLVIGLVRPFISHIADDGKFEHLSAESLDAAKNH